MKSSVRTFVLAAIAAASFAATTHTASAQVFSSNASGDHQLGGGGAASVMVLALPYAGTYMLGGQQMIINESQQPTEVVCWISTTNGGAVTVPYGPISGMTAVAGAVITLPLSGSYTATGPTDLWVVCKNEVPGTVVLATNGNITAMYW